MNASLVFRLGKLLESLVMILTSLSLTNFRNHAHALYEFSDLVVVVGNNAVGKTNILEAINLLGTGDSFRATRVDEMVRWGEEVGHVAGKVATSEEELALQVTVTRGVVQGKKVPKRLFKVNGSGKLKSTFVGLLPVVLFRPEDLELLTGQPSRRRGFMDAVLSQIDREYARSLVSYEKALKRRNKLLDLLREGQVGRSAFAFWDQLLIKDGNVLTDRRMRFIEMINQQASLAGRLRVEYDKSTISPERLRQYAQEEVAVGYTLVGPHKDDFKVVDANRDLALYGSRGEQRMAVLWLKEAQLSFMTQELGYRPLLLLDDILSELDERHSRLIASLCQAQQTIITTTEEETAMLVGSTSTVIRVGTHTE